MHRDITRIRPGREYECLEMLYGTYIKLLQEVTYGYGNLSAGSIVAFCLKHAVEYDESGKPLYRRNRY